MVYYALKIPLFSPKERDSNDDILAFFSKKKKSWFVVVQFCRTVHSREPLIFILTSVNQSSVQAGGISYLCGQLCPTKYLTGCSRREADDWLVWETKFLEDVDHLVQKDMADFMK